MIPWRTRTLAVLLIVSVVTNLVFVTRLYLPDWRQAWRLARIAPPLPEADDHRRGNPAAGVTVIEYSDYQCPYCAKLHAELRELADRHELLWIYRHYTGNAGHPQAQGAAEAAECAGEQNRFWEYSDSLFSNQPRLGDPLYAKIAASLDLDAKRFQACLSSGKYRPALLREADESARLALQATPTWFVNGRRVTGAVDAARLEQIVAEARASLGKGT